MEPRHLRYFLKVAAAPDFTCAAEKLNIARPPFSRQIRRLAEDLGAQPFMRGARPLETTEAGRRL